MKKQSLLRTIVILVVLVALLATGTLRAGAAPPPAPTPVSPTEGSTIVTPTFSWLASSGAAKYEVQVGPQSDPNLVYWSDQTVNLTLTPNNASVFANAPLYWRVRGKDSSDVAGDWSSKINFTKQIPAPVLVSPANGSTSVVVPTFEWQTAQGAAYYKIELSTSPTFATLEIPSYTTYNLRLTPVDALALNTYYWRVSGVDADGHVGGNNSRWFTLTAPSVATDAVPLLLTPTDAETITTDPTFTWTRVITAHHYRLIVSTNANFSTNYDSLSTDYNSYTPYTPGLRDAYSNDTYYWKVEARTSGGTVIATSTVRSFTKEEPLPLIAPDGATGLTADPTFQWSQIVGAHHYRLIVSTNCSFSTNYDSLSTDYNIYTPYSPAGRATYATGTYCWKVEARTSGGTVITTSNAWTFTIRTISTTTLVSSANPSTFGQSVTFTATVAPTSGSGTPTGTVAFKDGGTNIAGCASQALSSGQATCMTSSLTVGTHTITAVYSGDTNFNTSTGTLTGGQVVNQANTTTTLGSSQNPSTFGQSVTFTATVAPTSGSGTPTGTVAFKDGGTNIAGCASQALSSGQATCSTSSLTLGSHNITAVYGGDTNFIGSTSNTVAQVVNQISTATLVSSKNPSTFGQSVTFTVTVSGSGGTPMGTVTFKDGATTLGSGAVNGSGQATFTTSALAIGSHSITAEYGGDATFGASTSSALSQAVGNAMLYLPLVVR